MYSIVRDDLLTGAYSHHLRALLSNTKYLHNVVALHFTHLCKYYLVGTDKCLRAAAHLASSVFQDSHFRGDITHGNEWLTIDWQETEVSCLEDHALLPIHDTRGCIHIITMSITHITHLLLVGIIHLEYDAELLNLVQRRSFDSGGTHNFGNISVRRREDIGVLITDQLARELKCHAFIVIRGKALVPYDRTNERIRLLNGDDVEVVKTINSRTVFGGLGAMSLLILAITMHDEWIM